jgi:hypothetical protein
MTGGGKGCVSFLSPRVGARGGRQAMGGRAIGWDGGKNLQTRRMSPVGESEGEARSGWVGKREEALFAATLRGGGGGGEQEMSHPPPRPRPPGGWCRSARCMSGKFSKFS